MITQKEQTITTSNNLDSRNVYEENVVCFLRTASRPQFLYLFKTVQVSVIFPSFSGVRCQPPSYQRRTSLFSPFPIGILWQRPHAADRKATATKPNCRASEFQIHGMAAAPVTDGPSDLGGEDRERAASWSPNSTGISSVCSREFPGREIPGNRKNFSI